MIDNIKPATVVWFLLVLISIASWTLGVDHGFQRQVAAVALIALAFVKAGFVAAYFMDLRNAPVGLKVGMVALSTTSALAMLGVYLAA